MKESSAIHSTKRVHHKNSLAKISNAFEINIVVTVGVFLHSNIFDSKS